MNSFIFILVVAGFSVAQWLFKYLAAQAESRRQQQAQQRAELDLLRTGRTTADTEQSAPIDSDARRREELAELRRRAQARREPQAGVQMPKQTGRSGAATPLEILLGLPPGTTSGGTVAPNSSGSPRSALPSTLTKPGKSSRPQKDRSDPEARRRRQEQQRLRAEQSAAEARRRQQIFESQANAARAASQASAMEQRLLHDAKPIPAARSPLGKMGVVPRSAAEWRRAIAMNEVLSKPIAMR